MQQLAPPARPTFREALSFWLRLGFISFGGPAGQIAIMHTFLVDKKRWISDSKFLHALNYCMLLPGPEAQQLATYTGWMLHGVRGGLAAGILFVLPSAAILWGLSALYVTFGHLPIVQAAFEFLKPAVKAVLQFTTAAVVGVILSLCLYLEQAVVVPHPPEVEWLALAWILVSLAALQVFKVNLMLWIGVSVVIGLLRYSFVISADCCAYAP